ncbi:hypothetical protein C942_04394 [Photobacterium marinum]|uniref:Chaperone NapD n=1 Tax=Photobacterium marinum TaxID=1056511 RepID=L8JCY9_9GAMM|nr:MULTISPECIES: chaperone NapD [Photobacterium]ELR66696.1 hypothetical protein C942_04394 [Photobacterium marinum]
MDEYQVCSLVVLTAPEQTGSVKLAIEKLEGAEVPVCNEAGKMVVVLEGDSKDGLAERFKQIQLLPGVIAVTLVYHQEDGTSELKEANNESQ